MIELTFLKELMLIRQANQTSVIFVTIGVFLIKHLNFNQMSAIDAMIINDANEQRLMQKVMDGQTEVIHFLIEDDDLLEKYMLFAIKSVLKSKNNLMASQSTIKFF